MGIWTRLKRRFSRPVKGVVSTHRMAFFEGLKKAVAKDGRFEIEILEEKLKIQGIEKGSNEWDGYIKSFADIRY